MVNIPLNGTAGAPAASVSVDDNQKFITSSKSPEKQPDRSQAPSDVNASAASCRIGKIRV
jgi:hypothetical protein